MKWPAKPEPESDGAARDIRQVGMDLLARREHSGAELKRKLLARGFGAAAIETTMAGLARDGLLSDYRFTETFVEGRARRGQGLVRIRAELARRGVEPALAEEVIGGAAVDWERLAGEVRRKRFGRTSPQSYPERARQARFLQYRGFTAEQTRAALVDDLEE